MLGKNAFASFFLLLLFSSKEAVRRRKKKGSESEKANFFSTPIFLIYLLKIHYSFAARLLSPIPGKFT